MANRRKKSPSTLIIIGILVLISFIFEGKNSNNYSTQPKSTNINSSQTTKHDNNYLKYNLSVGNISVDRKHEYYQLSQLNMKNDQELIVNNNNPEFSTSDLSTSNGSWQQYNNLDKLNRVTQADALLNKNLMPHTKRERLYIRPTGFHNKKLGQSWLYNRSHLIGYQLTGQNNNIKNLMTGTRSLNSPGMNKHELDIATFLKENPNKYVRYQVRPIFRNNELVARGVQMKAQSIGTNDIHFNVYIFNVEKDVNIDYQTGYSEVSGN